MDSWSLLLEIVILLAVSLVFGGVLSRLGQSPLVGYLLAGMMLGGPGSLQVVQSEHDIEAIAELGVALLLFSLGLEFSWQRLKGLGRRHADKRRDSGHRDRGHCVWRRASVRPGSGRSDRGRCHA